VGILQNDAQRAAQVVLFDLADVDAIIPDLAVCDIVEAVIRLVMVVLPAPVEPTKAIFWPGRP